MDRYRQGIKLIEESIGGGKDNVISLATIALDKKDGKAHPYVREVDAYYQEGVLYVTTWGKSNKIGQIEANDAVAYVVAKEGISGSGRGENLGWVMAPENAELRLKLREVFEPWYDHANNEADENCVILAIHMTRVTIFREEGAIQYTLDLTEKKAIK